MSSLFTILAIFAALALTAAGLYLYTRTHGDNALFAPKMRRRLAFVERTYLDNGRKLLLVRRDDVEHLILIGGPIDLVVETGIPAEPLPKREPAEDVFAGAVQSYAETARTWQRAAITLPGRKSQSGGAGEPSLSLSPDEDAASAGKRKAEDTLELTQVDEAKAAK
ncbi:MAG: hypothetical protein ACLPX9_22285 [Rhodomicrobium sp.]